MKVSLEERPGRTTLNFEEIGNIHEVAALMTIGKIILDNGTELIPAVRLEPKDNSILFATYHDIVETQERHFSDGTRVPLSSLQ